MGEYANRKKDGKRIKIGTCEALYYLRYDQRNEVNYDFGQYEWFWRIPTPEEDHLKPGEFEFTPLHSGKYVPYELALKSYSMPDEIKHKICEHEGLMQVKNESCGLLANIPCYHGLALPEDVKNVHFFWNGRSDCLYLAYLKNKERELYITTKCKACGSMLSWTFNEIEPLMKSLWMKLRLLHQCTDYWYEHNCEPCLYAVVEKIHGRVMEIYNISGGNDQWNVSIADTIVKVGTWEECRDFFIYQLESKNFDEPGYSDNSDYYIEVNNMKERYLHNDAAYQYRKLKREENYKDAVLLFRKGDFYEVYGEDAKVCEEVLDISISYRGTLEVTGFPFQALDSYLPRLVRAGKRVAIID